MSRKTVTINSEELYNIIKEHFKLKGEDAYSIAVKTELFYYCDSDDKTHTMSRFTEIDVEVETK